MHPVATGMIPSQPIDWRETAAKSTLPDGTPVPSRVSDAIRTFLASASKGPLKVPELDDALGELLEAWSPKDTKDQNAPS